MTPAASSNQVLTTERTWVIVSKPAQPTALDVVRMFHARGVTLMDMQPDERGLLLRFKAERKTVAETVVTPYDVALLTLDIAATLADAKDGKRQRRHHTHAEPEVAVYELGSVYYARIEPRGETMTSIALMGRPTNGGVEACTPDPNIVAPCAPLESGPVVHDEISGHAEAEMINSIFSELRLEGSVVAPDLRAIAAAEETQKCLERRRDVEARAARVSNPRAKAGILRTAPTCGAPLASK
jgi:hypothetical protein